MTPTSTAAGARTSRPGHTAVLWVSILGLAAGIWLARLFDRPPAAASREAPAGEFSGARAGLEVERLLSGIGPHPIGTPANRVERDRILARLRALGYAPEIQSGFVCSEFRESCGQVENIVALRNGTAPSGVILLNCHYDSVPASPGAADDISGVASLLEIARLRAGVPTPKNTVVFLFNDGEEAGLLGSTLFLRRFPAASRIRAVVNLEARGSRGVSLLAETGGSSAGLVRGFARFARNPRADSAVAAAAALLPNANDLAVFRRTGAPGVMFGFVGGFRQYHSASDIPSRLDRGSLQHQGDNAMAVLSAVENADLRAPSDRRLIYATLAGRVVFWPESLTAPIASAIGIGTLLLFFERRRRGRVRGRSVLIAMGLSLLLLVLAPVFVAANTALIRMTGGPRSAWPSELFPAYGAAWCAVASAVLLLSGLRRPFDEGRSFEDAGWLIWSAAGVAASLWAPGFAPLFLLPAGFALVARFVGDFAGIAAMRAVQLIIPGFALLVVLPELQMFLDLAGLALLPVLGILMGLVMLALVPAAVAAGRGAFRIAAAAGLGWIAACAIAVRVPQFTPDSPQFLSLVHALDAGSGRARWIATGTPIPASLASAARFSGWDRPAPWLTQEAGVIAAAEASPIPPPRFELRGEESVPGARLVRGRIVSARGAGVVQLAFPKSAAVEEIRVAGVVVPRDSMTRSVYSSEFRVVTIWTLPAEGIEVTLRIRGATRIRAVLADRSFDLPAGGEILTRARGPLAAPNGDGDSTVVTADVDL